MTESSFKLRPDPVSALWLCSNFIIQSNLIGRSSTGYINMYQAFNSVSRAVSMKMVGGQRLQGYLASYWHIDVDKTRQEIQ
jgi:hypothetical protein